MELIKLRRVRVYKQENLHAKVIVTDERTFVGSANASRNSRERLEEAVMMSTDARIRSAARRFVLGMCRDEIGPEELKVLQKMYRPPNRFSNAARTFGRRANGAMPHLRIEHLHYRDPPPDSTKVQVSARRIARTRMRLPRRHVLDDFWRSGYGALKALSRDGVIRGRIAARILEVLGD
jgi:phosphatidylserine/phosphatidylglycerophosphate/cardiolipin synthase-like enzyme